jgi:aminoglycoside phosphotransferase (APT) family kinase protein
MTFAGLTYNPCPPGLDQVKRLVAAQFPEWADLPVTEVTHQGWDNRTYRLGADLSVRLPSAEWYANQVLKERQWLPFLAPHLPLPIPVPVALGSPADDYPWHWSVNKWVDGEVATVARIADQVRFAEALAGFLSALQLVDPAGGPAAGVQSFFRGDSLRHYDAETRRTIGVLGSEIDGPAATDVWERALAATWIGSPVWFHGDVASGNLLVRDGTLAAVIDFGTCGVGDPACDVTIAWTFLSGSGREAFRRAMPLDAATWTRGRGWAIWKAMIALAGQRETDPAGARLSRRIIADVIADHRQRE